MFGKNLSNLYPPFENYTTCIAILRIHARDTNYIYDILFQPEIYVHCFCQMSTMFPREPGIWCGPRIRCRNWKTSGLELNEIKGKIIDQHKGQKALFQS